MFSNSPLRLLFSSEKQYRLFLLLCLTTVFNFTMIGYRLISTGFDFTQINNLYDLAHTRSITFLFLVWNLFLAWVPYCISLTLERLPFRWLKLPSLCVWLVFFPNAPYLVTDLLHVHYRPGVPLWYDTLMLFSFAWTGLLLGFLSLMEVQRFLEKKLPQRWVYFIVAAAIGLGAFGVYLGRYQRWNSWDLLLNPYQLFWDSIAVLAHPLAYLGTFGLAVMLAGMLGVVYLTLRTLMSEP
jgi:uncharacterized membrane protein